MTYSTNIVNLTPHSVTLLSWSTNTPREVFPASGVVARCVVERHSVANAIGLHHEHRDIHARSRGV